MQRLIEGIFKTKRNDYSTALFFFQLCVTKMRQRHSRKIRKTCTGKVSVIPNEYENYQTAKNMINNKIIVIKLLI